MAQSLKENHKCFADRGHDPCAICYEVGNSCSSYWYPDAKLPEWLILVHLLLSFYAHCQSSALAQDDLLARTALGKLSGALKQGTRFSKALKTFRSRKSYCEIASHYNCYLDMSPK